MKRFLTYTMLLLVTVLPISTEAGTGGPKPPKDDFLITITTGFGEIKMIMYDKTPNHKKKFRELVESGYFKSTSFFRSVNSFFLQGGDPKAGSDGIQEEPGMPHKKGAVAAMASINPNTEVKTSFLTQFYVVTNPEGINFLDKNYTVFGEIIQGMDIIEKIANLDKDSDFFLTPELKISVTGEVLKRKKITKLTGYQYPAPDAK